MKDNDSEQFERGIVLGTRLDVTTYEQALERMIAMVKRGGVAAVAAANTHLIGEAVKHPEYAAVLADFELVVPDGMPLVWALRLDGHTILERVYGPRLMSHVLMHAPSEMKHYFFGGTTESLHRLEAKAAALNRNIKIAGAVSPPFGKWDEETEEKLIAGINASDADFIWVALGGVKQERWIYQNRHRFKRGVFLAVGDAFALVSGMRSYAPEWMQRMGLTWLYRLMQEPQRLLGRYLHYNTRFLFAFLMDRFWSVHRI